MTQECKPLNIEGIRFAMALKRRVKFHPTFLAWAKSIEDSSGYNALPVKILDIVEDPAYPGVAAVLVEHNKKKQWLTINHAGEFPTKNKVPVFTDLTRL
jgi:hypothetical protein